MDKEKWIDNAMRSLEGSERARPDADLFDKIEQQIDQPAATVIPLNRVRVAAVAAVLLVAVNAYVIRQYMGNVSIDKASLVKGGEIYNPLSNYEIYN